MKTLSRILVWTLAVLAILVVVALLSLDGIIKKAVNEHAGKVTQTPVHLERVSTSLINTRASLGNLTIGNPAGFSESYLFRLGDITIDVDRSTLAKDVIVINRIAITDVSVLYELAGTKSNISALLDNIAQYTGSSEDTKPKTESKSAAPKNDESSRRIVIRELTVKGAEVSLAAKTLLQGQPSSATLKLPDLTLRNIGDDRKGTGIGEAIARILNSFSAHVTKEIANSAFKNASAAGESAVEGIKKGIKGLFGN